MLGATSVCDGLGDKLAVHMRFVHTQTCDVLAMLVGVGSSLFWLFEWLQAVASGEARRCVLGRVKLSVVCIGHDVGQCCVVWCCFV
jgi:hypothetical protein